MLVGEDLRRFLGDVGHLEDADDRHVGALTAHHRFAEAQHVVALGHLAADAVEALVLDEDHRVVVADRRLQQRLGVGRGRGAGDQQAGDLEVERLEAVGVGRAELMAAASRHPDHHRHLRLAVEHVGDRRGMVDDLVQRQQREVDGHQLDDRPQATHRGADPGADDRVLGDRRVAHPALAELVQQAVGDLEGAAEDTDVLAHHEDALVAPHLLGHRVAQSLAHPQLGHQLPVSSALSGRSPWSCGSLPSSSGAWREVPSIASPWIAGLGRSPSSSSSA